jgi:hypothetical protein
MRRALVYAGRPQSTAYSESYSQSLKAEARTRKPYIHFRLLP